MENAYEAEREKYLPYLGNAHGLKQSTESTESTEITTTPLFSLEARYSKQKPENDGETEDYETDQCTRTSNNELLPQYGLLGFHVGDHQHIKKNEPILLNTRAPNSIFICGSQGSGKSYSLSCMVENCLLRNQDYGSVANPVAGLAFHYDTDDADAFAEVASLCSSGIHVKVLVSYSNYRNLRTKYLSIAGANNQNMTIEPLAFRDDHLNIDRMHKLMAFSESDNGVPLYVEVIHRLLRESAISNQQKDQGDEEKFSFAAFKKKLKLQDFVPAQINMLNMRIGLIESFIYGQIDQNLRPARNIFKSEPGSLTIVDLSDPFIDPSTACMLFDICLGLFKHNRPKDGMIIVLDEAHKYLDKSANAAKFTEQLLTTIRMQRHYATRVVIATQEPTISEKLLDLCSVSIVHRFTSPAWFAAIKDHLAAAFNLIASEDERKQLLEGIVNLGTGESFVFSPSSFVCFGESGAEKLGIGVMKMRTRMRKGVDSGKSKMAGEDR